MSSDPLVNTLEEWIEIYMQRSMRIFFHRAKEMGISMPQFGALHRINKSRGGVSDLGDEMAITSGAASQMLERLVQQGLITRSEDPSDRRVKRLILTTKGSEVLKETTRSREGWAEALAQGLSAEEKEQIIAALNILINKAKLLGGSSGTEQFCRSKHNND